eukprot:GHRQ01020929.1.p2 GENE.GHRQ01020929.1~~GHRQ01020929.1.p2  ORF type:complete len:105 (+),score=41.65 GHRQ01020929.1:1196-1510(+)
MFGKTADDLQQANAADDEYMISDNDLLLGRFISIPKSYSSFVPGSLVAGIVRGMLDSAGFPARWGCCGCRVTMLCVLCYCVRCAVLSRAVPSRAVLSHDEPFIA